MSLMYDDVLDLLRRELDKQMTATVVYYKQADSTTIQSKIEDFYWLANQENLASITDMRSMERLVTMLTNPEYKQSRMNFILRVTGLLKFQLGAERWNTLIQDVVGSLAVADINRSTKEDVSLLSTVNQWLLKVDANILRQNHWLVPIVIYGMMDVADQILAYVYNYDSMIKQMTEETSKSRKRLSPVEALRNAQ